MITTSEYGQNQFINSDFGLLFYLFYIHIHIAALKSPLDSQWLADLYPAFSFGCSNYGFACLTIFITCLFLEMVKFWSTCYLFYLFLYGRKHKEVTTFLFVNYISLLRSFFANIFTLLQRSHLS